MYSLTLGFTLEMTLRLLLASFLGGLIGFEREAHGRAAGFRTHLLVALGACLFAIVSIEFYRVFGSVSPRVDPSRVASQIVVGIGFLGAGAIIHDGRTIRGLTTAACLWVAAAIGIGCAIGLYQIVLEVTAIALISLLLLKRVEDRFNKDTYSRLTVVIDDGEGSVDAVHEGIRGCGMEIISVNFSHDFEKREITIDFDVKFIARTHGYTDIEAFRIISGVKRVGIENLPGPDA